jgi:hypothetical protein
MQPDHPHGSPSNPIRMGIVVNSDANVASPPHLLSRARTGANAGYLHQEDRIAVFRQIG